MDNYLKCIQYTTYNATVIVNFLENRNKKNYNANAKNFLQQTKYFYKQILQ